MGQSTFVHFSFLLIPIADLSFQLHLEGSHANSLIGVCLLFFIHFLYLCLFVDGRVIF